VVSVQLLTYSRFDPHPCRCSPELLGRAGAAAMRGLPAMAFVAQLHMLMHHLIGAQGQDAISYISACVHYSANC